MLNLSRINWFLLKRNLHNQTSLLLLNIAERNFGRNYKISTLSSSNAGVPSPCRYTVSVVPPSQSLFSSCSQNKSFISSRNFSKSSIMWSGVPSNQRKEKLQNYIFFGTIVVSVIFVLFMFKTMEYHQDYVHIEPSENK